MQKIDGCTVTTAKSTEEILNNIKHNINHGAKIEAHFMSEWREGLPIAIVGGGPSLKDTIKDLANYRYMMVCGSAHDYVIKNSPVKPTYCILCDPDELIINYLQEESLHTKYLIASQCDPKVFEHLKDYRQFIWHAGGNTFDIEEFGDKPVLGGGCTIGTRAIAMAIGLGFTDIHLFGMDTCLTKDYKHHAYDFNDPDKETIGNITEIQLEGSNKKFALAGYMLGQLFDFQKMMQFYAYRIRIKVFGEGLLKELIDIAEKKHLEVQNGDKAGFNGLGNEPVLSQSVG